MSNIKGVIARRGDHNHLIRRAGEPVFWRPAPDAADQQRPYLARLIEDDAVITLVADTGGRLAASLSQRSSPRHRSMTPGA